MSAPNDSRNLSQGVPLEEIERDKTITGRVDGEEVLLVQAASGVFAVGARCTHYKGPLAEGLIVGDTIRCPWHHACFSLKTGEAIRAPALDPVPCWTVESGDEAVRVSNRLPPPRRTPTAAARQAWPESVVIVGGGAAGHAAAEALRFEGYDRPVVVLSASSHPPCDRPSLSKDYLAGSVEADAVPLHPAGWYVDRGIELVLNARVSWIDVPGRAVRVAGGNRYRFGRLLLATGAEPVRLKVPGAADGHVHYLRTVSDSEAIIAGAAAARRAVVVGASFIGLEVAASLRARGLAVDVVSPEGRPMERVLGPKVGRFIQCLHESHGVGFHLGRSLAAIDARRVTLDDGSTIDADLVVVGIGVEPRLELARQAHLAVDRGVVVDERLETTAPGVFAAGDIARWPDPHTGQRIRVEHWVVAERQGAVAGRNMLGGGERFDAVPFFWSQHYDVAINYVGHAASWDTAQIDGDLEARDCSVTYRRNARRLAVATIGRDRESLEVEVDMERVT